MKERPILFSGEMVRAILDGRKSQTRRVLRIQPVLEMAFDDEKYTKPSGKYWTFYGETGIRAAAWPENGAPDWDESFCPYGQAGDRLWVRETFYYDEMPYAEGGPLPNALWQGDSVPSKDWTDNLYYRADGECCQQIPECSSAEVGKVRWRPGIHMPRWASRLCLDITQIRVERVREITNEDAFAEGCDFRITGMPNHAMAFAALWDKINLKRGFGWDANPWVWVIQFKRVTAGKGL